MGTILFFYIYIFVLVIKSKLTKQKNKKSSAPTTKRKKENAHKPTDQWKQMLTKTTTPKNSNSKTSHFSSLQEHPNYSLLLFEFCFHPTFLGRETTSQSLPDTANVSHKTFYGSVTFLSHLTYWQVMKYWLLLSFKSWGMKKAEQMGTCLFLRQRVVVRRLCPLAECCALLLWYGHKDARLWGG